MPLPTEMFDPPKVCQTCRGEGFFSDCLSGGESYCLCAAGAALMLRELVPPEPPLFGKEKASPAQEVDADGYVHETLTYITPKFPEERLDLACGDCDAPMRLRTSEYGVFYGCTNYPKCKGKLSASSDGIPLGVPANQATRMARRRAHAIFDQLWKTHGMTRDQAYEWLRVTMGVPSVEDAHLGKFDIDACEKLVRHVLRKLDGKQPSVWRRLMGRDPF